MYSIDKQMQELYDRMGWGKYTTIDLTRKEYFPEDIMKTFKSKKVKVTDKIYCDICGESCTKGDEDNGWTDHEYATIEATWGYWSKQDGTQYNIEMCEKCFNEVLESIKKKRKKFLGPFKYPYDEDPLKGKNYFPS